MTIKDKKSHTLVKLYVHFTSNMTLRQCIHIFSGTEMPTWPPGLATCIPSYKDSSWTIRYLLWSKQINFHSTGQLL